MTDIDTQQRPRLARALKADDWEPWQRAFCLSLFLGVAVFAFWNLDKQGSFTGIMRWMGLAAAMTTFGIQLLGVQMSLALERCGPEIIRRAGAGLLVLGIGGQILGVVNTNRYITVGGTVVAVLGALALNLGLRSEAALDPRRRLVLGVPLLIAGLVLTQIPAGVWAGLLAYGAGLLLLKLSLLPWIDNTRSHGYISPSAEHRRRRAKEVFYLGLLLAALGWTWLLSSMRASHQGSSALSSLAAGLSPSLLGVLGLSMVGLAGQRLGEASKARAGLLIVTGLFVFFAGFVRLSAILSDWVSLALVSALFMAGVGAWFVFRGEGLFLLVVVGVVLAWAMIDRDTQTPPDYDEEEPSLLALGDSFISGEGARDFYSGTNTNGGSTCRRAATAAAALVASELDLNFVSLACSGAEICEVATSTASPECDGPTQLDLVNRDLGTGPVVIADRPHKQITAVVVAVGGNDIHFKELIELCLLPSDCSERAPEWVLLAESEELERKLKNLYRADRRAQRDDLSGGEGSGCPRARQRGRLQ